MQCPGALDYSRLPPVVIVAVLEGSESATYQSHSYRCGVCRFRACRVTIVTYLTLVFRMPVSRCKILRFLFVCVVGRRYEALCWLSVLLLSSYEALCWLPVLLLSSVRSSLLVASLPIVVLSVWLVVGTKLFAGCQSLCRRGVVRILHQRLFLVSFSVSDGCIFQLVATHLASQD